LLIKFNAFKLSSNSYFGNRFISLFSDPSICFLLFVIFTSFLLVFFLALIWLIKGWIRLSWGSIFWFSIKPFKAELLDKKLSFTLFIWLVSFTVLKLMSLLTLLIKFSSFGKVIYELLNFALRLPVTFLKLFWNFSALELLFLL